MLGVTHPEVGACVLDLWGIPRDVCELVRWHHEPWGVPRTCATRRPRCTRPIARSIASTAESSTIPNSKRAGSPRASPSTGVGCRDPESLVRG